MNVPSTSAAGAKRALVLIFSIMLMDIVGISILSPVAPYIVREYNSNATMVTLLSVIYAAAQFLAAPFLGKLSDRIGRRPVLLVCILGSALGYFMFGIGGSLWVLFLSRLVDGISGGNMSTASAYIIDISKPEERAKNMTLIGMAYGFGFILGPILGGALGQISLNAPLYAAGAISLVNVALVYFILPESLPRERRETSPMRLRDFNPLASIGDMLARPGLSSLILVYALFNFAFDGTTSILGVFFLNKFTTQTWQTGLFYCVSGIGMAIVQGVLIGRLVPRFGEKALAIFGVAGFAIGAVVFAYTPSLVLLVPVTFLVFSIIGFVWPTVGSMTSKCVSAREQGQLAGVNASLGGLTAAIGPLGAGLVYDQIAPVAPFWAGSIVLLIACLVLLRVRPRVLIAQPASVQPSAD